MNILFIICGGIAAYKSCDVIRECQRNGHKTRVIMTPSAVDFITPLTLETLSCHPVLIKDSVENGEIIHIRMARWADKIVVIPATADFIGKMANGFADDLASTTIMAADSFKYIIPAMNPVMWHNPAVQRNIKTLQQDGCHILTPSDGTMACGETGVGKLPNTDTIINFITE